MSEVKTTSLSHKDNDTGTPNITMYSDGTTSLNYAATTFKNALINGGLDVEQRSGSREGGNGFVTDRWYVSSTTPGDINTATATFPGQEFARYVRIGNGNGARNILKQTIELPAGYVGGKAGAFTVGSTWTFSFYHKTDTAAPADPQFGFATTTGGADAVSEDLDEFTDVTGDTASDWQRKSVTFTIDITPNAGNICAYIQFSGDNTECAGFQLEPGPVASVFEHRFISIELLMCQRYYEVCNCAGQVYFRKSDADPLDEFSFPVCFKATKRIVPTCTAVVASGDRTDPAVNNITVEGASGRSVGPFNKSQQLTITADAEL